MQPNRNTNCFRDFIKYASLNIMGMLGLSFYILADTFFIAKGLGADGLTALNLAIPIYSFIHGSGLMIGMGGGIKYAIQKNQRKQNNIDKIFTNAVYLVVILAVFFGIVGIFFSGSLVTLFGADENVFFMTKTYIKVILLFAPAFLMNNVLLAFVRNDGAPQLSMAAMLAGSLSNIGFDYIFMFPCKMGIFGAAFATGLAPVISMLILAIHFMKKKNKFHFVRCRYSGKLFIGICSSGIPSLITEMSSGIVMIIFNTIILSLKGNVGVAAYGVIANLSLVVIAIYTGIVQGMQPMISDNYGAGNMKNVQNILKYALVIMLLLSVFIYAGMFFLDGWLVAIFNSGHNEELQMIAMQGLKLYFTAVPFVGFNMIISAYFTSMESARPAQIISLLRGFFIIIPMALILSDMAGMIGVWCVFPATELFVMVIAIVFYGIYKKKNRRRFASDL